MQTLGHEISGSGSRRVIVLNDWLCDTSTWGPARPYLDPELATWAFADLRGYGRSRDQRGTFTIAEAAADVATLAEGLGWERFTIVGHSMSSLVAAHVAQTIPDRVERAILVTPPPPRGFGYDDAIHARLREVALGDDAMRAKALDVMLGDRLGAAWKRFKIQRWRETSEPAAVAAYVAMFGVNGLPDPVTPIARPVFAVAGEHDAPPMRGDAVARAFAELCPELSMISIADSGHYPMQETPPLFAASVQRFLAP